LPGDIAPAGTAATEKVVAALQANNIDVRVVDTGEDARRLVLELVPQGAEVHSGKSKTPASSRRSRPTPWPIVR
jgi:hypothetical protein